MIKEDTTIEPMNQQNSSHNGIANVTNGSTTDAPTGEAAF